MIEFKMPKLGADMSEGTLVSWRKQPGDVVHRGDIVAEVETEKGIIDVEIFENGVIQQLLVRPGEKATVGTPLALVREEGAPADTTAGAGVAASPPQPAAALLPADALPAATAPPSTRIPVSPAARKLAEELKVELADLRGTGPGGAVTREDVQRAAAAMSAPAPSAAQAPGEDTGARMRQAIASAMSRSKREIPHYYLTTTIDMHPAVTWLAEANGRRPLTDRLLYGALLVKAVALALRETPELNAVWENGRVVRKDEIHVGLAISLRRGGLVAPALHHTDQQPLDELMRQMRDLVERARTGAMRSSELSDPTITVTSLGDQGVETVLGVIYPPQVALVGFGKLVERPWCVQSQVVPRPVITASLSADHRVSDGHRGGLFLAAVERLLADPETLARGATEAR